jgi:methionyl-tRNA formyltransferase
MKSIIANSNPILDNIFFSNFSNSNFYHINKKKEFTLEVIEKIQPDFLFFPHWSYIIPQSVFEKYNCIVFHMTDLPFGRGGSPLQNLISRGIYQTKITAIKVVKELDAGPIYLKRDLSLYGNAEEIYLRSGNLIIEMINFILNNDLSSQPQSGEPVLFKRRTPEMSVVKDIKSIEAMHDFIRMLDATGYPKAFIENDFFKFEISRASIKSDNIILADVRIFKK